MFRDMESSIKKYWPAYEENAVAADVQGRRERPSRCAWRSNSCYQHAFNDSNDVSISLQQLCHLEYHVTNKRTISESVTAHHNSTEQHSVQILQAIDKQTQHLETFSRNFEELSDKIISGNSQPQASHEYHVEVQEIGPKLREIRDQSSTIQETVHETSQQLSVVASQNSSILSSMTRLLYIITSGMLTLHSLRRKVVELVQSWSAFTAEMRDFTKQTLSVDSQGILHQLMKNLQTNIWANTRGS